MTDAILFSAYLPKQEILPDHEKSERLHIGKEFMGCFKQHFSDADIYIGINPNTDEGFENMLKSYTNDFNNLEYTHVPAELYTRSDASGYQSALKLLKESNKEYDLIWFGHTKGGHYNDGYRAECRRYMLEHFFGARKEITNLLNKHEEAGVFGNVITVDLSPENPNHVLDHYYKKFKYSCTELCYLYTFYVIKGFIVKEFVDNCEDDFWIDNLRDRFWFEQNFPHIATKMGYEQLYESTQNFPKDNIVDETRVEKIKAAWRRKYEL